MEEKTSSGNSKTVLRWPCKKNLMNITDKQNRNRNMGTWNRLTAIRREGKTGRKELKRLAKHIYMTHRYKQLCGDSKREGGVGDRWRWAKPGGMSA